MKKKLTQQEFEDMCSTATIFFIIHFRAQDNRYEEYTEEIINYCENSYSRFLYLLRQSQYDENTIFTTLIEMNEAFKKTKKFTHILIRHIVDELCYIIDNPDKKNDKEFRDSLEYVSLI